MEASLLLSHGHAEALNYPIGMLRDEAAIISEIDNRKLVSLAFIMRNSQAAVMVEEGSEIFADMIEMLNDG